MFPKPLMSGRPSGGPSVGAPSLSSTHSERRKLPCTPVAKMQSTSSTAKAYGTGVEETSVVRALAARAASKKGATDTVPCLRFIPVPLSYSHDEYTNFIGALGLAAASLK